MVQQKIIDIIEEFAPLETQLPYDHCGLKTGDLSKELTGVLVCLDLSPAIVDEAKEKNCNLIIEHHPSIWNALETIDVRFPKVRALIDATNNGISVYSAHTNIDFAQGGLNDVFAAQIGLSDVKPLPEGRIGALKQETDLYEYAEKIKDIIGEKHVKVISGTKNKVKNVVCVNGAGGGDEESLLEFSRISDVFVTSEVKYNVARLSKDIGYAIIEVGHFTSEKGFLKMIKDLISKKMPNVRVYEAECVQNPYE